MIRVVASGAACPFVKDCLASSFFWILDYNGNGAIDNVNLVGGDKAFAFGGITGDVPVVGDWNADGKSKVGVFRAGFFWVLDANGNDQFDGTGPGQDLAFALVGFWVISL